MKKMYIICFLVLGVAFSGVYYGSYRLTRNRLSQQETEENKESLPQVLGAVSREESIITRKTSYVLEEYSLNDNSLTKEATKPPVELLGFDRRKLMEYIQEYMDNMPEDEKQRGLISYELSSFSESEVVLRKTYYREENTARFYLDVQMGRVVVCQTEDDSLYAYTELKFAELPEALQREILAGKYIETVEELYHFLETYSS